MAGSFFDEDACLGRWAGASRPDVEEFYSRLVAAGLPLKEAATGRATFVWLEPEDSCAAAVHLQMNRVSDKQNYALGFMRRVSGTQLWVRTLDLPPALRASYGFVPIEGEIPSTSPRPGHGVYSTLRDPGNRELHCGVDPAEERRGNSVYAGPQAPAQPHWIADDGTRHGMHEELTLADGLPRKVHIYLPPAGRAGHAPCPLVMVLDADAWFVRQPLAAALDRAIGDGTLPLLVVAGPECVSVADRQAMLGANPEFLSQLFTTIRSRAVAAAREQGREVDSARTIVAGQSLGGVSALATLMYQPGAATDVIAQSPSLWWSPSNRTSPGGWRMEEPDWLNRELRAWSERHPERGARIRLQVGAQEGAFVSRVAALRDELDTAGWDVALSVYEGGHDYAWWRGALIDELADLLRGPAKTPSS